MSQKEIDKEKESDIKKHRKIESDEIEAREYFFKRIMRILGDDKSPLFLKRKCEVPNERSDDSSNKRNPTD